MNRKSWKNIFALLGNISHNHKDVLIGMVGLSVFMGSRPFITVILTGMLVDAVYAGEGLRTLLYSTAIGVGGVFLMSVMEGFLTMFFNRKLEYMQEIQAQPLNKKSMSMDYEYLEDVGVHEMRQRIEKFGGWSLAAIILSILNKMITAATTVLVAICVVIPMFVRGNHSISEGFVGSWLMSLLLFGVVLLLVLMEFKLGSHYSKLEAETRKELSNEEAKSKYYLDIMSDYEKQKDLRICKQQNLYEKEFRSIDDNTKKTMDKMAHFIVMDIFTRESVSSLTGFLVYVFAGVLACMGMISIGGVVTYAASILKFMDAIGRFAYLLSWLNGNSTFANDYVEYMNLPQRKHEGTIPIEKRQDGKFSVEFEHVSFKYPGSDTYVIKDLTL